MRNRMDKKYPDKYVVIYESDTGYMDCVAICDKASEAYGEAYLSLIDGLDENHYYVSLADKREGENGYIIKVVDKDTGKVWAWATILFYRNEEDGEADERD